MSKHLVLLICEGIRTLRGSPALDGDYQVLSVSLYLGHHSVLGKLLVSMLVVFFFSGSRRHTKSYGDWSSDVCSSDLIRLVGAQLGHLLGAAQALWLQDRHTGLERHRFHRACPDVPATSGRPVGLRDHGHHARRAPRDRKSVV